MGSRAWSGQFVRKGHAGLLMPPITLLAVLGFLCDYFELLTAWVWAYILLSLLLVTVRWWRTVDDPDLAHARWRQLGREGSWELVGLAGLVGLAVYVRIADSGRALIFLICYVGLGFMAFRWLAHQDQSDAREFKTALGLMLGPPSVAWLVTSAVYAGFALGDNTARLGWWNISLAIYLGLLSVLLSLIGLRPVRTRIPSGILWTAVLGAWILMVLVWLGLGAGYVTAKVRSQGGDPYARATSREAPRPRTSEDPTLAVALSGGGYRAAVAHAGLLWVLDEAGVPVNVISAVSGGAIVGTTYALGWSPLAFKGYLAAQRPGLPNDFLNVFPFMAQLLCCPWGADWGFRWGSGDTYVLHFQRVYFQRRTLRDAHSPVLILNATQYGTGRRAAFWPGGAHDDVKLARLVAASAAFPVAFDPVSLTGDVELMDGGVVENLGVEGLRLYLTQAVPLPRSPNVLIVSDVSAEPETPKVRIKPSPWQMALHAQEITYRELHARIFDEYSVRRYERDGNGFPPPYDLSADGLWPGQRGGVSIFILGPTSPAERRHFATSEERALVEAVVRLDTLKELSRAEVEAAFWVGAKVARAYLDAVCERMRISCAAVTLPATPPLPQG